MSRRESKSTLARHFSSLIDNGHKSKTTKNEKGVDKFRRIKRELNNETIEELIEVEDELHTTPKEIIGTVDDFKLLEGNYITLENFLENVIDEVREYNQAIERVREEEDIKFIRGFVVGEDLEVVMFEQKDLRQLINIFIDIEGIELKLIIFAEQKEIEEEQGEIDSEFQDFLDSLEEEPMITETNDIDSIENTLVAKNEIGTEEDIKEDVSKAISTEKASYKRFGRNGIGYSMFRKRIDMRKGS